MLEPDGFMWTTRENRKRKHRKMELVCSTCLEPAPVRPRIAFVDGEPVMRPYEYVCEHPVPQIRRRESA